MRLTNETPFESGWTMGFMPDGREAVVVAVKATYRLRSEKGAPPILAEGQEKLREADEFGDDPATDAPRYENDFALFKPRCDVLVKAQAYAPQGRPTRRVDVGLRVGGLEKTFSVVGPRVWVHGWTGTNSSDPLEFVVQPISYDTAFGGTDVEPEPPNRIETYFPNPAGIGFCKFKKNLDGMRMPLTEERGAPIREPMGSYTPMALGPIGRSWAPRFRYAGTYDARWQETKLPFLPDDFDFHYFQAAPPDQTMPYPAGGEPIALVNLSREGRLVSELPRTKVFVTFLRKKGRVVEVAANLDTVLIEPDDNRLCLTWRVRHLLARDPFELSEMVVERSEDRSPGKSRARATGKTYYASLADLPKRKKG